jgi:hypothetical protein
VSYSAVAWRPALFILVQVALRLLELFDGLFDGLFDRFWMLVGQFAKSRIGSSMVSDYQVHLSGGLERAINFVCHLHAPRIEMTSSPIRQELVASRCNRWHQNDMMSQVGHDESDSLRRFQCWCGYNPESDVHVHVSAHAHSSAQFTDFPTANW